MSSEAAILRGKGLVSNPAFFMIFAIAASMGVAGLVSVGVSGTWGWGLAGGTAALFGVAWVTGLGEKLFVVLLALVGFLSGLLSTYIVFHLWGPVHDNYLVGSLLAVVIAALPIAAIAGEKVLPLFVAFVAGVWGVTSIIVLVMVLFRIGMGDH